MYPIVSEQGKETAEIGEQYGGLLTDCMLRHLVQLVLPRVVLPSPVLLRPIIYLVASALSEHANKSAHSTSKIKLIKTCCVVWMPIHCPSSVVRIRMIPTLIQSNSSVTLKIQLCLMPLALMPTEVWVCLPLRDDCMRAWEEVRRRRCGHIVHGAANIMECLRKATLRIPAKLFSLPIIMQALCLMVLDQLQLDNISVQPLKSWSTPKASP